MGEIHTEGIRRIDLNEPLSAEEQRFIDRLGQVADEHDHTIDNLGAEKNMPSTIDPEGGRVSNESEKVETDLSRFRFRDNGVF